MASEARWYGGPADPIAHFLPEQNYEITYRMYWMTRLTHIEEALTARGYSPAIDADSMNMMPIVSKVRTRAIVQRDGTLVVPSTAISVPRR